MQRYALRDDQRAKIKDFLPGREGHVGGTATDNRLFVDAIIYRTRSGIPWRDLPERYGDWKPTHKRLRRWCESGVFARILEALALDADAEFMSIDSTSVRAHQHSAGAQKKTARTKPSAVRAVGCRPRSTLSWMHSATLWLSHSRRAKRTTLRKRCRCSTRSSLRRFSPTRATTPTRWSRRSPSAASRRSSRQKPTARCLARPISPYIASVISSSGSSAKSNNSALSQRYDKLANTFLAAVALVCVLLWLN